MAAEGEETEYVSDPEDAILPTARRREASDDEDDDGSARPEDSSGGRRPASTGGGIRGGGADSEDEGGAPYDEEYEEEEEVEEYEEDDEEEGDGGEEEDVEEYNLLEEEEEDGDYEGGVGERGLGVETKGVVDGGDVSGEGVEKGGGEENAKEIEPFVVPKAGPFYMHDDRFKENRGFRGRRTPVGNKLWDSKDDRAWMHDKFEEMNLEDEVHEQTRNFRGRYRGRGKSRGNGRGYGRGRKDRAYENKYRARDDRSRAYDERSWAHGDRSRNSNERSKSHSNGTKNRMPKIVRGRGPRRYEPLMKNKEIPATPKKQVMEVHEPVSKSITRNQPLNNSSQPSRSVAPPKQVFTSCLNSASPPFYPSGSSSKDYSVIPKRDIQSGNTSRNAPTLLEDNMGPSPKGKTVGYVGHDKFLADNSFHHVSGKRVDDAQLEWSSSSIVNTSRSAQLRVPGRDFPVAGQSSYYQDSLPNKAAKSSTMQPPANQQRPAQVSIQPMLRAQSLGSGMVASSQIQSKSSSEVDESEFPNASNKSKSLIAGKEKPNSSQNTGPASFLYGGAPIMGTNGTMGLAHGTQGFPGTPALLPVMQFCGQNPGGLGVPAVGLALPGYVAQSQPGGGNSEMTWMPALASAGALGASYGQYFAIDGGYARPSSQASSTSRDGGASQSSRPSKSPQNSDTASDEAGQRQNKPRRYSEMNFGQ